MTRRFLLLVCLAGAATLGAQTTKKAPAPTPAPAGTVVTVSPARADVQPNQTPATQPVTADTDKDLSNPRALRLSLDDALKTSIDRNVGVQIQRFDYLMAGQSLRSSYGIFD